MGCLKRTRENGYAAVGPAFLGQGAVGGAIEDRDRVADKGGDVDGGAIDHR